MSREPQRKFEYQNKFTIHEGRFDMLNLPTISTKAKNAPNLVPSYDKMAKETPFDKEARLKQLSDRSYSVQYGQILKKPITFNFTSKKHSDV